MSLTKNQKLCFWKAVESQIRSKSLRMAGVNLSQNDTHRVANAYVMWALVVQDLLGDSRLHSDKSLSHWVQLISDLDVSIVIEDSKRLLSCIRCYSPYMGVQSVDSFKHYLSDCGVDNTKAIFLPFWYYVCKVPYSPEDFYRLNTILSFITRLTLQDTEGIEEVCIRKYVDKEIEMKGWVYDPMLIFELRQLFLEVLPRYPYQGRPRHGSGATFETGKSAGCAEKFSQFKHTWRTYQLSKRDGWDHPLIKGEPISQNDQMTRVIFVPKGIDKKRVISVEPTANQYYQHAIMDMFCELFHDNHTLFIDLQDQSYNQRLAMVGSGHGSFATVDLSDASDSVTHTLIKGVMERTWLYSLLERCRSSQAILPDGTTLTLEKYAPMGSAVCFPIECLIFSLIVKLACKHCGVDPYYRVYGDDIVVPDSIYSEVISLLNRLHFTVNTDKTFAPYSVFTESCGIECYLGSDVSPVRVPRFYDLIRSQDVARHPSRVTGLIAFANTLYDHGLLNARSYVVQRIQEIIPEVPFSFTGRIGLASPNPTNYHLKHRWNKRLYRPEVRYTSLFVEYDRICDDDRYYLTLEALSLSTRTSLAVPLDRVEIKAGRSHTRLKTVWEDPFNILY